jgi:hypothetical protein
MLSNFELGDCSQCGNNSPAPFQPFHFIFEVFYAALPLVSPASFAFFAFFLGAFNPVTTPKGVKPSGQLIYEMEMQKTDLGKGVPLLLRL